MGHAFPMLFLTRVSGREESSGEWSMAVGTGDENRRKGDSAATTAPYARAAAREASCCR